MNVYSIRCLAVVTKLLTSLIILILVITVDKFDLIQTKFCSTNLIKRERGEK